MYANISLSALDQAVIVENVYFYGVDEHLYGIVLTPTCDFAQRKCELVQLCAVYDAWDVVKSLVASNWRAGFVDKDTDVMLAAPLSKTKQTDFDNKIGELARQRFARYHWLSPFPGTDTPRIADFQCTTSIPIMEAERLNPRYALISPFREEVPARYAAYMGRVGTPDVALTELAAWAAAGTTRIFT